MSLIFQIQQKLNQYQTFKFDQLFLSKKGMETLRKELTIVGNKDVEKIVTLWEMPLVEIELPKRILAKLESKQWEQFVQTKLERMRNRLIEEMNIYERE